MLLNHGPPPAHADLCWIPTGGVRLVRRGLYTDLAIHPPGRRIAPPPHVHLVLVLVRRSDTFISIIVDMSRLCGYDQAFLYRTISLQSLALSASARPRARCIRRGFCPDRAMQPARLHYLFSTCLNCFCMRIEIQYFCYLCTSCAFSPLLWPPSRIRLVIASYS